MEADFQRYYGIDYLDRWRGKLSLRRIHVLMRQLPAQSATASAMRDYEAHWSLEAVLLDNLRMAVQVAYTDPKNPPKPHSSRMKQAKRSKSTAERELALEGARKRRRARQKRLGKEG